MALELFIDTANIDEVKAAKDTGLITGVTTNPQSLGKTGKEPWQVVRDIAKFMEPFPVSAQITTETAEEMIEQGKRIADIGENVVVKVPAIPEGFKALLALSEKHNTNVTNLFTAPQALLVAIYGATYASIWWGRAIDFGVNPDKQTRETRQIYDKHQSKTKILSCSIKDPQQLIEAAVIGADIITVPYDVFQKLPFSNDSVATFQSFLSDWRNNPALELNSP